MYYLYLYELLTNAYAFRYQTRTKEIFYSMVFVVVLLILSFFSTVSLPPMKNTQRTDHSLDKKKLTFHKTLTHKRTPQQQHEEKTIQYLRHRS